MINPNKITNFHRTDSQLQEFLLFSICVAGKNSKVQAQKLDLFLVLIRGRMKPRPDHVPPPFEMLSKLSIEEIDNDLRCAGMGQYNRISKAFYELANSDLDLKSCAVSDLEQISGIGPKTARFFILHSRKDARCAALDVHILKHLRTCGIKNVPKSTPQSKKEYARLEKAFVEIYDKTYFKAGVSLADYDLIVWQYYSQYKERE